MEKITLEKLLDRKKEHKEEIFEYNSKILGGTIDVVKMKLRDVLAILEKVNLNKTEDAIRGNCELIYKHCPLFRDSELLETYEVAEPYDIVLEVFEQNSGEINNLCAFIFNLYGLAEDGIEQEYGDLKN